MSGLSKIMIVTNIEPADHGSRPHACRTGLRMHDFAILPWDSGSSRLPVISHGVVMCQELVVPYQSDLEHGEDVAWLDEALVGENGQTEDFSPSATGSFGPYCRRSRCPLPGHPVPAISCHRVVAFLDRLSGLHPQHPHSPDKAMFPQKAAQLAAWLYKHFKKTNWEHLLFSAITLEREALRLRPVGHPDRCISCTNLALYLHAHFKRTGAGSLLDEAAALVEEVIDLCPVGHPYRATACANSAVFLKRRFEQTGERDLLDAAIARMREGLSLRPTGHPERAAFCENLAALLEMGFDHSKSNTMLDEAIVLQQETHNLRSADDPHRAASCGNLAALLVHRFDQTGDCAYLDRAIVHQEEAQRLCPSESLEHGSACLNLAVSLRRRLNLHREGSDAAVTDHISALLREALVHYPSGHPGRWRCLDELAQLALLLLDWDAVLTHLHAILETVAYDDMRGVVRCVTEVIRDLNVGAISDSQRHILLNLHSEAISLVGVFTGLAIQPLTQIHHAQNGWALGLGAFVIAAQVNELSIGLELLERVRGVIWSQALHMRDPQLGTVPYKLADRLQGLIAGIDPSAKFLGGNYSSSARPSSNMLYAQRRELQDAIQEVRMLPGFSNFMRGPDIEALMSTAAWSIVVVLVATEDECHALVISRPDRPLVDILIPHMNRQLLEGLGFVRFSMQSRGSHPPCNQDQRGIHISTAQSPSSARLAKLWHYIVKPIFTRLCLPKAEGRARPRLHWCCTGPFAFLPVHAAGIYAGAERDFCSQYVVSSYTPTLAALLRAQSGHRAFTKDQIKLMAIASSHVEGMPQLPSVEKELKDIMGVFRKAGVHVGPPAGQTDITSSVRNSISVMKRLESANIVHLACHGIQNVANPFASRFRLGPINLDVERLMRLNIKQPFFAFLSACETAKGDQKHADEIVHLAATMLFSGFKSVVATMWAMQDDDGPFIAKRFYRKLLENNTIDVDSIPYAVDDAVTALRMSGVPPERWATFMHMGA